MVPEVRVVSRKIQKRRQLFIKFPCIWADRLIKARHTSTYRVALHLLYQHWKQGGGPIKLGNRMLTMEGVGRSRKWEALVELEELGLATVERRGRKAPLVTIIL